MFGQQGNGELLLGRGGFDGSVGNGFSNETGTAPNSGSITTPGQSGSSAFDLSDFPSLGGSPGAVAGGDNNSLANALRQQQQILVQQQSLLQGQNNIAAKVNSFSRLAIGTSMANALGSAGSTGANFKMATEDFPALPGAPLGGSVGNTGSGLLGGVEGGQVGGSSPSDISFGGAPASSSTRSSSNVNGGVFGGDLDGLTNQFDSASLLGSGGVGNLGNHISSNPGVSQQRSATSASTGAPIPSGGNNTGGGGSALSGDYGLLGLLKIIRLSDADRNALAVGSDLTSLGLNLNSSENLYSTFASPWSDSPANREPQYQLPMCYYMQPPALKTGHLSKFQLETLFYIFYALPKDVLQAYAAQELYSREWKFHVELKLWFKRASPTEGGQFVYFDINSWERRLFNGNMNQNITSGLLPEDDIRVKFSSS
eukprot:scaffold577_cov273-Chaetoceros_neogracile.AAC.11